MNESNRAKITLTTRLKFYYFETGEFHVDLLAKRRMILSLTGVPSGNSYSKHALKSLDRVCFLKVKLLFLVVAYTTQQTVLQAINVNSWPAN